MAEGIFFFIVGPSGGGKDSLIDGARSVLAATERYIFARRVITRPLGAPGEEHQAMTTHEFKKARESGQFLATWKAHGLDYGLPVDLLDCLKKGLHVIANGSRAMVSQLALIVPRLVVIEVTAPPEVLFDRIINRGRESVEETRARIARQVEAMPLDVETLTVMNDGSIEEGVARFVQTLARASQQLAVRRLPIDAGRELFAYLSIENKIMPPDDFVGELKMEILAGKRRVSVRLHKVDCPALLADNEIGLSGEAFDALGVIEGTRVVLRRMPSPGSRDALIKKVKGGELTEEQYSFLLRDIVDGRYTEGEISTFLVTATQHLSDNEVLALAKVRASLTTPIAWNEPIVVDKHSMGGVPGSRITLIVVPIVAAFGLAMPKTSSRAITSASGTADVMEVIAKVDLTSSDVVRCVGESRACIAWNGRMNHSILDDLMNAMTRPLGLDSNRWSVASILSKKLSAGSTHVIVDLPFGPQSKLKTEQEARQLGDLFEFVGAGLGLTVKAIVTDGSGPIGRGIGPALEMRDVQQVLAGDPAAPQDLREKALIFASQILSWDPSVASVEQGRRKAEQLLASGAAQKAFERIVDAQGRTDPIVPGRFTHTVRAVQAGYVSGIDGWTIAGIARRAGAPGDKSAGVDLRCGVGERIALNQPLYVIHSNNVDDLGAAVLLAATETCFFYST